MKKKKYIKGILTAGIVVVLISFILFLLLNRDTGQLKNAGSAEDVWKRAGYTAYIDHETNRLWLSNYEEGSEKLPRQQQVDISFLFQQEEACEVCIYKTPNDSEEDSLTLYWDLKNNSQTLARLDNNDMLEIYFISGDQKKFLKDMKENKLDHIIYYPDEKGDYATDIKPVWESFDVSESELVTYAESYYRDHAE